MCLWPAQNKLAKLCTCATIHVVTNCYKAASLLSDPLLQRLLLLRRNRAIGIRNRAIGIRNRAIGIRNRAILGIRNRAISNRNRAIAIRNRAIGLRNRAIGLRNRTLGGLLNRALAIVLLWLLLSRAASLLPLAGLYYIHTHRFVCIYICMYMYTYTYMNICMYMCV